MRRELNESEFLLNSVMAQKAQHARVLLGSKGLTKTGTKHELREKLAEALDNGIVTTDDLVEILDDVESWGRQHVFLYETPNAGSHIKQKSGLQSTLKNIGWNVTLNEPQNLIMPISKSVRLVSLNENVLRVEWIETRKWTERVQDQDYAEEIDGEEVVFQATKKRHQRAISAFEWNLMDQTAALFIHQLPSGTRYKQEEEAFRALLRPLVDLDTFDEIRMKRAITKIKDQKGIRERRTNYVAATGSKLSMQSSGRAMTIGAEPELKEVRDLIKQSKLMGAAFLNCFWEANSELEQEVHTHMDVFDCRVGFLGQYTEESVRYVLSRIRKAAS